MGELRCRWHQTRVSHLHDGCYRTGEGSLTAPTGAQSDTGKQGGDSVGPQFALGWLIKGIWPPADLVAYFLFLRLMYLQPIQAEDEGFGVFLFFLRWVVVSELEGVHRVGGGGSGRRSRPAAGIHTGCFGGISVSGVLEGAQLD